MHKWEPYHYEILIKSIQKCHQSTAHRAMRIVCGAGTPRWVSRHGKTDFWGQCRRPRTAYSPLKRKGEGGQGISNRLKAVDPLRFCSQACMLSLFKNPCHLHARQHTSWCQGRGVQLLALAVCTRERECGRFSPHPLSLPVA